MDSEIQHPSLSVFFLASDLGPTGAARQLQLLAAGLPRDRFRIEVGVLGPADTPAAGSLRTAGITVRALPLRHLIDFRGLRELRGVVAAVGPAVVHAWGPPAVWAGRLVTRAGSDGGTAPRLVVSASAAPSSGVAGWLTARCLRRADRVVPTTWADAERYRRLGVPTDPLTRIGPAVTPTAPPARDEFLRGLGLPPTARLIVTAGRVEPSSGLKTAIWAFDMLRYEFPDLYLLVFGEGPDRAGLEAFGRAVGFDDFRVRFPGSHPNLPGVLGLAEVVWVTHDRGGVNLALEAMAAGRPVVGWKTPDLAEVVAEGGTGFLVGPGDRAHIAARTHALLHDPARATAMGDAGRARATERYGVGRMVEQYVRVYEELTR
ncbi:MAG: kanE 1 [Gemmataceae bacterium]|nr:kanE 1 [Gemmataceae bacterium]